MQPRFVARRGPRSEHARRRASDKSEIPKWAKVVRDTAQRSIEEGVVMRDGGFVMGDAG